MDSVWRDDIMTFAPHRTVEVAHGTPEKRKQIIEEGSDYVVINYDGVEIVSDTIAKGGFDLIIVDEATHYKNSRTTIKTRRTVSCRNRRKQRKKYS